MPRDIVAIDFFLVPTLTFRLLFIFVVLRHGRRELLHLGVTDRPTATWTAQQLVEVFPNDTAPTYLLRDRDGVYGDEFVRRIKGMAIHQVLTAPCAPWQNPFVERVIGSIRRRGVSADVVRAGAVERRVACSGPRQRCDFREIQGLITSFEGRARRGRRRRGC
jgi:putative transposase